MSRSTDRTENAMIAKTDSLGMFSSLNVTNVPNISDVFERNRQLLYTKEVKRNRTAQFVPNENEDNLQLF